MTDDFDWDALDRYLSGESTPAEVDGITRWSAADADNAQTLEFMKQVWAEAGTARPVIDEERVWLALQARIATAQRRRFGNSTPRALRLSMLSRPARSWRTTGAFVAAAALIAIAVGIWQFRPSAQSRGMFAASGRDYTTARGQRAELMLMDGTRVWLSVDSRLRVPEQYGMTTRDVDLNGEAFFDVKHDAKRPFRVHARGAVTEVLGTEFSVRAYPDDPATVVVVASGKVEMTRGEEATSGSQRPSVALGRRQMGRLESTGRLTVVDDVDLDALQAWRTGRLVFEERPLREVIRELERWYDLEIQVGDSSLVNVPVTASLSNHTADQALAIVAATLDVRQVREGRTVRLTSVDRR